MNLFPNQRATELIEDHQLTMLIEILMMQLNLWTKMDGDFTNSRKYVCVC